MLKLLKVIESILYDSTIEEEHYRKLRQKSLSNTAIIVGLVAAVGGFLYGYDTGLINDILEMHYVTETFPLNGVSFTSHERALITAILSLGTFFGALVAPLISDNYGRKFLIILSLAIIFNVGNLLQCLLTLPKLLCAGRAILGLSVGILSAIVPLYQAEASPKWVRGSVVFTYQWAITWGLMIASAVCQGTRRMGNSGSYRIPVGLQFLWAIILCTGMLFLPESPRYYVQNNNIEKALESLTKLRRLPPDDPDLIEELVEIKANYDYELLYGKTTVLDCFRNGGGRHKQVLRMITGIGVHAFQQCSGINFIFYYGVNFFSSTGMKNYYIMSFITYVVNTVFTIPGIVLVDVIGRRKLMLFGGLGMCVSNLLVAITGVSVSNKEVSSILSISFSCVFIAFFASSWGGAVWAIASDIYGISIRQKAISITAATNWLVNFTFAFITPYLIDTGQHTAALGNRIFFIWGGLNALGVVFVYFCVYETKGLKLEEVDFMYVNCHSARSSTKFVSGKVEYSGFGKDFERSLHESANTNVPSSETEHTDSEDSGVPPETPKMAASHTFKTNTATTTTTTTNVNTLEDMSTVPTQAFYPLYNSRANNEKHDQVGAEKHDSGEKIDHEVIDEKPEQVSDERRRGSDNRVDALHKIPSFSSDSGSISDPHAAPAEESTDYQIYLESLKREYQKTALTKLRSNRGSVLSLLRRKRRTSGTDSSGDTMFMLSEGNEQSNFDSVDVEEMDPKMTVIAAPLMMPPSDSDSE